MILTAMLCLPKDKIDILCLSETRLNGVSKETTSPRLRQLVIFLSFDAYDGFGDRVFGFLIGPHAQKSLLPWNPVNPRIARIQIKEDYPIVLSLLEENKTAFKKYKNQLSKIIRNAKTKSYFDSFKEISKSPKKAWELINSCLNQSQRTSTPSEIKDAHGHIIERDLEIASYMNPHFASIGQSVPNKLQHNLSHGQCDYHTYLVKPSVKSMFLTPVTEEELANIGSDLDYVDDIDANAADPATAQEILNEIAHYSRLLGMKINKTATTVMDLNIQSDYQLLLLGQELEKVDC
ncbi:hypothetical protein QYM36_011324 [Artemia franciscana]|uniref:Uncharacterized protein n=1 Tax=Artemia franciscana TaxID=6661 RepID=A0AA88HYU5_ARTSF|nr:hypothetical protein QYM36_011324 [Artemia franciscana]